MTTLLIIGCALSAIAAIGLPLLLPSKYLKAIYWVTLSLFCVCTFFLLVSGSDFGSSNLKGNWATSGIATAVLYGVSRLAAHLFGKKASE